MGQVAYGNIPHGPRCSGRSVGGVSRVAARSLVGVEIVIGLGMAARGLRALGGADARLRRAHDCQEGYRFGYQ